MRKLEHPLSSIEVKEIFENCVNAYDSENKRKHLLTYSNRVVDCSKEYDKYMPTNFESLAHPILGEDEKKELLRIYSYMFVEKRIGGYYDKIMSNANRICPFCGEGVPRNLDHFLPKTSYQLLVITPDNLVPSCRDCNMDKSSAAPTNNRTVPLHPYFDKVSNVWLEASIDFSSLNYLNIDYYNSLNKTKDEILFERIETHIKVHALKTNFATHANSMVNSKKRNHFLCALKSTETLKKDMMDELCSFEYEDINSWRAALYRSLIRNVFEYADWLKKIF